MIATLEGKLAEASPVSAVIEAGGVGYEVFAPVTTMERLPPVGQTAKLYTHAVYREDSAALYGFHSKEDRALFQLLTKVSGIGPKIGLSVMSKLSAPTLRTAIASGDAAMLAKCPGLGKKTAERLVVELKDKVGLPGAKDIPLGGSSAPAPSGGPLEDAIAALVTLGFKPPQADKAARQALEKLGPEASVEEIIKRSLG